MKQLLTPRVRRWAYGVTAALVPVAAYFGWIDPGATAVILPLLLAFFNVPDDEEHGQ